MVPIRQGGPILTALPATVQRPTSLRSSESPPGVLHDPVAPALPASEACLLLSDSGSPERQAWRRHGGCFAPIATTSMFGFRGSYWAVASVRFG
jgi:hypothetical protein